MDEKELHFVGSFFEWYISSTNGWNDDFYHSIPGTSLIPYIILYGADSRRAAVAVPDPQSVFVR